jgi:hypothetical protein
MQKICLLTLLLLSSFTGFGQFSYFTFFNPVVSKPCPFNSNVTVTWPQNWSLYQTTDNTWEGPVDITHCISATMNGSYGIVIDLGQIDPSKPLFVRADSAEFQYLYGLDPNFVFNASFYGSVSDTSAAPFSGANCTEDVCTGMFIGISIPGSVRYQNARMDVSGNELMINSCFPSEYFSNQRLKELVLKFQFKPNTVLTGKYLKFSNMGIESAFPPIGYVSAVAATPLDFNPGLGEYFVDVAHAAQFPVISGQYLMLYTAPTFPSPLSPSYVIGSIEPNPSTQQVINLVVNYGEELEIQPFTYLKGALVDGSDSVRHKVNLINNGGDFCLNFIDFVYHGGTSYRHSGGTIQMHGPRTCMKFQAKSELRITHDASLHYGNDGFGMLVLCTDSKLTLEKSATLVFDGTLSMSECDDQLPSQQLYMDLPPGARLLFTDHAHITNQFSKDQRMKLNVRMLGGTLEDEALAPDERALINRIYPDPEPRLADNLSVSPNPFSDNTAISFLAAGDEDVSLVWTDLEGKPASTEKHHAYRGMNTWNSDQDLPPGIYMVTLVTPSGIATKKMIKTGR